MKQSRPSGPFRVRQPGKGLFLVTDEAADPLRRPLNSRRMMGAVAALILGGGLLLHRNSCKKKERKRIQPFRLRKI